MEKKVAILRDESNAEKISAWFSKITNLEAYHHPDSRYYHYPAHYGYCDWHGLQPGYTLAKDWDEFLILVQRDLYPDQFEDEMRKSNRVPMSKKEVEMFRGKKEASVTHTLPSVIHPINFAGYIRFHDEPYYEAKDMCDADMVGMDQAIATGSEIAKRYNEVPLKDQLILLQGEVIELLYKIEAPKPKEVPSGVIARMNGSDILRLRKLEERITELRKQLGI